METDTYYHYYNRGNNRENIFREEANYAHFLRLMKKHLTPVVDLYSYCLLPNHFHLILKTKENNQLPLEYQDDGKPLWQPFSNLFNAYAKAYNKKYHRSGSLFQKIPKQLKIESTRYLQNLIVYVNTNSAHHGIADYHRYPHSSYSILISQDKTSLKRNEVLELFDGVENLEHALTSRNERIELLQHLFLEDD